MARGLTLRPVLYLGKTSYSLYLWHWPVFTLMRWTTGLHTPLLMLLALTVTGALAFASYHWVETPVRRARLLARPAWRAVVAGLAAMLVFWTGAVQLFVVGNSHTGAYATMVSLLEQQTGMATHLHQMGRCALGNLLYPIAQVPGCAEAAEDYLDFLRATARPGDVVFLASLRTHRLSDQWFRNEPEEVLLHSREQQTLGAAGP